MAGAQSSLVVINRHVTVCLSTAVHKHSQTPDSVGQGIGVRVKCVLECVCMYLAVRCYPQCTACMPVGLACFCLGNSISHILHLRPSMGVQQKQREREAAPRCVQVQPYARVSVHVSADMCVYIYVCIYLCIYILFLEGPEFNLPLTSLALTSMLLGYLGVREEGDWV